jgi:hypothetical protein
MKKFMTAMVAIVGVVAALAQMPRSEWHAKVGDCALEPALLKATIAQLSAADKTAFLAEVNDAISKMPGSAEVKAAKFLAANRAAVAGAGAADRLAVLAEVYATVPVEYLTVINEEMAKSDFSRPPTMNDSVFVGIVSAAMEKIAQRCASAESGSVRSAFAGLMFVRAAGTAAEAAEAAVVAAMPEDVRKEAKDSWYPAALGKGQSPTYDPMLGVAQAGDEPDHAVVITLSHSQLMDSMLFDLQSGKPMAATSNFGQAVFGAGGEFEDAFGAGLNRVPRDRVLDPNSPFYTGKHRGDLEPDPYRGQKTAAWGL